MTSAHPQEIHTFNGIEIVLTYLRANGIRHRIAMADPLLQKMQTRHKSRRVRPSLIMFLHGWPDIWFTWRYQLAMCARHGYLAVAPDMRGCGGTNAPKRMEEYNVFSLANDVLGIVKALGYDDCILVGHDWGAWLSWSVALMFPTCIRAVCAFSVPFSLHRRKGLLTHLREKYGDSLYGSNDERRRSKFNYMLHHNLIGVEKEYEKHDYEALYRILFYHKGVECTCGTPECTDDTMFPLSVNCDYFDASLVEGMWSRLPRPIDFPDWCSEDDFTYILNEFRRSGFLGGLMWYRTPDLNWKLTRHLDGLKISQPTLFIAGTNDNVVQTYGGPANCEDALMQGCEKNPRIRFFNGYGHWVHQEKAEEVNKVLLQFLDDQSSIDQKCFARL